MTTTPEEEERTCVYEEAYEMLLGAVLIYLFAEMRDMVREGKLPAMGMEDLEPPLTSERALGIIQANKEALSERALDHEYLESRLSALKHAQSNQAQQEQESSQSSRGNFFLDLLFSRNTTKKEEVEVPLQSQVVLTTFMDDKANEEIVHAIVVNQTRKRVTIVFRGSVTQKDFLQDAKCAQRKVINPVLSLSSATGDDSSTPQTINLHSGFYEYLFLKDKATGKTRLEIVLEDAKEQLRLHPGFTLCCTGHSLGGALATLCGFYSACDDELLGLAAHRRVVVYSIASPFCGNWKFRHAFQELERQRRLQHLRIANLEDMVTLMPFAVPKATALSPALSLIKGAGNLYKHVGIKLQIKQQSEDTTKYMHSINYTKDHQFEDDQEYAKEIQDAMEAGKSLVKAFYYLCKNDFETIEKYHSCDEYETRLETCKEALTKCTLDDLYNDKKIVGKLFAEDYRPSLMSSGMSRTFKAFSVLTRSGSKRTNSTETMEDEEELTLTEAALLK
jgi:predicted lipase